MTARDGDTGFVGVDMRTPPQNLPAGYVSEAVNTRFRFGVAEPRRGLTALNWAQLMGAKFPLKFPIQWNTPIAIGEPVAVGEFNDPNGVEWLLIAAKDPDTTTDRVRVFALTPNNRIFQVPTPVALSKNDTYWFTQCFNELVLHRGTGASSLSLTDVSNGFTEVTQTTLPTDSNDYTETIPNGLNSLFYRNRLFVTGREETTGRLDVVRVSDYLNYTRYIPVFGDYRINQGDSDDLVVLAEYNDENIVVFKSSSIYVLNVPSGNVNTAYLSKVTDEFGIVGSRTVIPIGPDLWFLSQYGITSIRQTEFGKLQGRSSPLSQPMQPIIDRVNWEAAKTTAVGAYYKDRAYWSLPIDGSKQNNCVIVYDFQNQSWSGYDYWDGAAKVAFFAKMDFIDGEKLFYVDYDGGIGLYEYGTHDSTTEIPTEYKAQLLLACLPETGDRFRVNEGDWVSADRATETNSGTTWGVGYDTDLRAIAVPNLQLGLDSGGWVHNTDSVRDLDLGVEFTDTEPISVRAEGDCLKVFSDAAVKYTKTPILHHIVTRGYFFNAGDRRRTTRFQVHAETWDSKVKVEAFQDGVEEVSVLVDESSGSNRDMLSYTSFGSDNWDPSNSNNDFSSPYREDYTVKAGATDASTYALKMYSVSDIKLENHQAWTRRVSVERRGAFVQFKLSGLDGRTKWNAVAAASVEGRNQFGQYGG